MNKHITASFIDRLEHFTISFLAILLGFVGFSLAYFKAEHVLGLPGNMANFILYFTIGLILVVLVFFTMRAIIHPHSFAKELNHPIKLNFFPIFAKIALILSIIYLGLNMTISKYLWWLGVVLQFGFTIYIMSSWIRHSKFKIEHMNPSWFIPIVGSVLIPIAGIKHFSPELSWFFFSIGIIWWLLLFVIVINRMIFHEPIADKLIPTLFILFAPPAIGFISLVKLLGEVTVFAKILYYFALFMFILVLFQLSAFKKIKFFLSWWAYSFPVVAMFVSTILMYEQTELIFFKGLSWAIFVFLNVIMLLLIYKTIIAIRNKTICVEEIE